MPLVVRTHFLPPQDAGTLLAGGTAIVIDVLRATTVIAAALEAGATEVFTFRDVAEAVAARDRLAAAGVPCLLGGERGGLPIPGFDLSNSPGEYVPGRVAGRTIAFTTTNGTRAVAAAAGAARLYAGSFACGPALVDLLSAAEIAEPGRAIHLICAGTNGTITREDVLFAGWVVSRLFERFPEREYDDATILALGAIKSYASVNQVLQPGTDDQSLARALRLTQGGRNLAGLGLGADILSAARLNTTAIVPTYDFETKSFRRSPAVPPV